MFWFYFPRYYIQAIFSSQIFIFLLVWFYHTKQIFTKMKIFMSLGKFAIPFTQYAIKADSICLESVAGSPRAWRDFKDRYEAE